MFYKSVDFASYTQKTSTVIMNDTFSNVAIFRLNTLTKSAVMMASSVWEPGNQTALMMKLPVASCGCSTRWSDTEPVLLKVKTWQSWKKWREYRQLLIWYRKNNPEEYCLDNCSLKNKTGHLTFWFSDLKTTHSQVILIAGVSCEAEYSERNWGRSQAGQR